MRVSNNMIMYNFLSGMNKSLSRQNTLQEQLSDGLAIHRPSDDPVKATRSLTFNSNLVQNEQFTQNLQDAQSWMQTTDNAMSDLSSTMITIKEQVVYGSNGTNPQEAVQTIGTLIDNLINHIVEVGNTKLGDRYVFGGQNDKAAPFTRIGDAITYNGDDNKISMPIKPGAATPSQDSVNLTGVEVFGAGGTAILNRLIEIKQHLMSGTTADQAWLSTTGLQYLDDDHSAMLQAQTELGTRMSAYDMNLNMLQRNNTVINSDVAANDDLDVPKAITDLKTSENVYKSALAVGSRIMPVSLVDFLK